MKSKLAFFDRVQKLREIDRCSNTPHIKPYSVAQHSFYVTLYALVFAHIENERITTERRGADDHYYNVELVLQKALVHDLEESETGDILFPLHSENPEFKDKLDFIRNKCVEDKVFKELPELTKELLIRLWKTSKDNSTEGNLVACMDKFEILMYAVSEVQLGNNSFHEIYRNAIHIITTKFKIPSVLGVVEEIRAVYGV